MDQAVNITGLAASFRLIVEGACQVVRAYCREDWVIGPRFGLINNGLMRRLLRFERIVALLLAGVADPVRPARAARATAASAARSERKRCERWPSRKGWLLAKLGWRIALYGYRLQLWLGDPENAALVRSSRKLRRVLRPIWNALTTDPLPDCLREPPREARSDATHEPAREPSSEPPRGAAAPAPGSAGEPAQAAPVVPHDMAETRGEATRVLLPHIAPAPEAVAVAVAPPSALRCDAVSAAGWVQYPDTKLVPPTPPRGGRSRCPTLSTTTRLNRCAADLAFFKDREPSRVHVPISLRYINDYPPWTVPAVLRISAAMTIGTRIFTWLNGRKVGSDAVGNIYYQHKRTRDGVRTRRWVMYVGTPEASSVPPEWHAWLHYTTDAPLPTPKRPWIKPHEPNLTGTAGSYRPPGHDYEGGKRAHAAGDYESWTPGS